MFLDVLSAIAAFVTIAEFAIFVLGALLDQNHRDGRK